MRRVEHDWMNDAAGTAEELIGAILKGDVSLAEEKFPEEWIGCCDLDPELMEERISRLREEWIGFAGSKEPEKTVRTVDVRLDETDENRCTVYFEFGRPFADGRLDWPVAVELTYADGAWQVCEEWFRRYILDEDGEC